jgi:hypothetical protein
MPVTSSVPVFFGDRFFLRSEPADDRGVACFDAGFFFSDFFAEAVRDLEGETDRPFRVDSPRAVAVPVAILVDSSFFFFNVRVRQFARAKAQDQASAVLTIRTK